MSDLTEHEQFNRIDLAFAKFLCQRSSLPKDQYPALEVLLATLSQKQHQGHNCITINLSEKSLLLAAQLISNNPATRTREPLIIEADRLYTQRYWFYETRLAQQVSALANISVSGNNLPALLDRFFGIDSSLTDWQKAAAKMACQKAFAIITGGPGTGKTTTLCKILAILLELSDKPLRIALAAPTGKAAARVKESISGNLAKLVELNCSETILTQIPKDAITLHRLLGSQAPSPYFRHNAANPLPYDIVVVDEASMVDLALMSKLVDALKPEARLILLGDKDQLASVEAGSVLADLIQGLPNNTVTLKQAHRFDSTIKNLAEAVNQQNAELAWDMFLHQNATSSLIEYNQVLDLITQQRADYLKLIKAEGDFFDIFACFNRFQVLCSNRHGHRSSAEINSVVGRQLFGQIAGNPSAWYNGRPVMVQQNAPSLQLFNGDIGICLPDKEQGGNLMVFFLGADGKPKKFLPARLPRCETVFAMTIHKSQGSEFDDVLIVLPDVVNPVLSKELLYTAITRAKKTITLASSAAIFTATVNNKITRATGLSSKFIVQG